MDLIAQLINAKKEDKDLQLLEYLTELIKYEKLSKSKKFKHITDSPLLQKQLPLCWSAFNQDVHSYWILHEASTILQNTTTEQLQIFKDLDHYYEKKQKKQMEIIGNTNQHQFYYYNLESLSANFDHDNAIYITNEGELDDEILLTIIQTNDNHTDVYTGSIVIKDEDAIENESAVVAAHKFTENNDTVIIQTYSVQGNNDYYFAETNNFLVSMPDRTHLEYQNKETQSINIILLPKNDIQTLSFYKEDLDKISEIILKNKPLTEDTIDESKH